MPEAESTDATATVHVKNVGGIDETSVDIPPGVTVLEGRNATNRTSFLQAIISVMGGTDVTLKGDADEGHVEMTVGEETYTRRVRRTDDGVALTGEPYLEDPVVADLFAFLLKSNEARQAVVRKADLRDVIMRPIDTDEIRAEIDRLERERDRIDDQLAEIDGLKAELPGLEERRHELEAEIEEKRAEMAEVEAEIEAMDTAAGETGAEKRDLEERLDELGDLRSEVERVRSEIDLQKDSIESLRQERSELRESLSEMPEAPTDTRDLDAEISRLRERKQTLETRMSDLQDVIQFNEEMLDGAVGTVTDTLGEGAGRAEGSPTDQLVVDDTIRCWTCGSEVDRERVETTLDELRGVRREYLSDVRDVETDLESLQETRRERESQRRRRERLERKLDDTEEELRRRRGVLEELHGRRDRLSEEVETVEAEVETLESEGFSEVLDLHKEANRLELEVGRLESDLDDVSDSISEIEDRLSDEDELRDQRDRITEDLRDWRTRIDHIEREAVEQFNQRMDDVLELLAYDNLARIWIERVDNPAHGGRVGTEQAAFELHVVRTTDAEVTYEDTVDHLSESEREVTGLVFALAGYLVHDVHETVPIVLLDSLEAIDAERIDSLVEYFSKFVEYLVIALLPEDARAISGVDTRITDI